MTNKYNAKRTQCGVCNAWCHSGAEARRCAELDLMERAGLIYGKENQPKFKLHAYGGEPIGKDGKYIADFAYWKNDGPGGSCAIRIVEDVKGGPIPPLSKWKISHAEAEYHFKVQIVRMGRCRANMPADGKITKLKHLRRA